MNYWITTHYPPTEDDDLYDLTGVWIVDGKERVAEKLTPGDYVLIYQSGTGKSVIRYNMDGSKKIVKCKKGKQGIVSITQAEEKLSKYPETPITEYSNGEKRWWCWYAKTKKITSSGFVSKKELNEVFGYKDNYLLKGFGNRHSGVKLISKEQFDELVKIFRNNGGQKDRSISLRLKRGFNNKKQTSEESEDHRLLKNYIAANPESALKEDGLKTIKTEYLFPTNDKADVVLEDYFGRILGLEVELDVNDWQIEGVLQAIKYKYMLEVIEQRNLGDSRAILAAYSISPTIKNICQKYKVECITIKKENVISWFKNNP